MKALLDAQKKELDASLAKCKELTNHVVSLTAQVATLQANDVIHVKKEIVRDLPGSKGKQVASQGSEAAATAPTASGATCGIAFSLTPFPPTVFSAVRGIFCENSKLLRKNLGLHDDIDDEDQAGQSGKWVYPHPACSFGGSGRFT